MQIDLDYPVEIDGVKVEQLTLRRLTAMDIELSQVAGANNGVTKTIHLGASAAGISPDDVRRLDAADFNKLNAKVVDFLG